MIFNCCEEVEPLTYDVWQSALSFSPGLAKFGAFELDLWVIKNRVAMTGKLS